ncbi:MAG TPA: DUF1800 domain-containing protein, partial [Planctomycetota bacterium]|nr:DUF1800 domain-containing protein [Planctomycetota bacterium]
MNRAAFGGTPEDAARLSALGREAAVDLLLDEAERAAAVPLDADLSDLRAEARLKARALEGPSAAAERRRLLDQARDADERRLGAFRGAWFDRMSRGPAPALEKATLFWSQHFTTSRLEVRDGAAVMRQHLLLRRLALGDFRALLHAIARDPAMLEYLDADRNRRGRPNENFAREVMELFVLGLGAYGEADVREAARAFTGWSAEDGRFVFRPRLHDFGSKTVLGRTGAWNGDDVLDVLLEQDAAPRFLARRLLAFYVAPEPSDAFTARIADAFRRNGRRIRPTLRAIFLDPEFDAARGARVSSPAEFAASLARKLPGEPQPGAFLARACDAMGHALFAPPNVKGWEGDDAWIDPSAILLRSRLALTMVEGADADRSGAFRGGALGGATPRRTRAFDVASFLAARGAVDAERAVDALCDHFLAVPVSAASRSALIAYASERLVDGDSLALRGPKAGG